MARMSIASAQPGRIRCACCWGWVPPSEAVYPEGEAYVFHFCGPVCYVAWEQARAAVREQALAVALLGIPSG
jgi:hypothetical protein